VARSFALVQAKVAEADFFLTRLREAGVDFFAARCYFSAFIASARSITFALQATMADMPGFGAWYLRQQADLVADPNCRFFQHARRLDQHVGINALSGGGFNRDDNGQPLPTYRLAESNPAEGLPEPPNADALSSCHTYFDRLIKVVFDCCDEFKRAIDPKVWFTKENFAEMGQTIEDAEEELYGYRGWTSAPGVPEDARWQLIRNSVWSWELEALFTRRINAHAQEREPAG
jgi:hypothetical protein